MDMKSYQFDYFQYKNKITKHKNFAIIPLVIAICLLSILCVVLKPKNQIKTQFFLVEIDNFSTYKDALVLAQEVQNLGAAGYIHFDGSYHVFASVYLNEKDAKTVSSNIVDDYNSVSIFSFAAKKELDTSNLSSEQKETAQNYVNFCFKSICEISELIVSFDKKEIDETNLKNRLKTYEKDAKKHNENLLSSLSKNPKFNTIKETSQDIYLSFKELSEFTNSSNLKYTLIKLVISYCSFVESF